MIHRASCANVPAITNEHFPTIMNKGPPCQWMCSHMRRLTPVNVGGLEGALWPRSATRAPPPPLPPPVPLIHVSCLIFVWTGLHRRCDETALDMVALDLGGGTHCLVNLITIIVFRDNKTRHQVGVLHFDIYLPLLWLDFTISSRDEFLIHTTLQLASCCVGSRCRVPILPGSARASMESPPQAPGSTNTQFLW